MAGTFTLTSCTKENPEIHPAETREEVTQLAEKYYTLDLPLAESRRVETALGKPDVKKTESFPVSETLLIDGNASTLRYHKS